MKKELMISVLAAGMLTLTGCGGSSDGGGTTPTTTTTLSAQFIDSAVQGLSYDCQSSGKTGITDKDGTFYYVSGDTCTFKVGDIILGKTQITGTTTPRSLTTVEPDLTNILRLLQTLDTDATPDNGITLPTGLSGDLDLGNNFDAEINTYLANNNVTNTVVTAEEATTHFAKSVPLDIDDTLFIGKTYAFSDGFMVDSTIAFNADHTYKYDDGATGTWAIQDNIITLTSYAGETPIGAVEFIFISETLSVATTYYISSSDGQHLGETVYDNVTYTVTDTVATPPAPITLTDAMFSGKTYTYSIGPDVTVNYVSDGTFTSTGDGDTNGTWTITDNKLVMTDAIGTTTITFTSSTHVDATAQDIGQAVNVMTDVPYTAIATPVASGERRSDEPLRAEIRSSYDNALVVTTNYTYNDNVVTASTAYDENNSYTETTTYQSSNRAYFLQYLMNYDYSYSNGDGTFTSDSASYSYNFTYDINQNIIHFDFLNNNNLSQDINWTYDTQNRMTGARSYRYGENVLSVMTVNSYDTHGNPTQIDSIDYDENGTEIGTETTTSSYTYYPSGNIESDTSVDQTTGETSTTTYIDVTIPLSVRVFDLTDRYTLHHTWDETGDGTHVSNNVYTYDSLNRKIGYFSDVDNSGACDNGELCTTYFYE